VLGFLQMGSWHVLQIFNVTLEEGRKKAQSEYRKFGQNSKVIFSVSMGGGLL
jgi:hypothetical protein